MRPGSKCIVSMSRRVFPEKVVKDSLLLSAASRCELVSAYFDFSGQVAKALLIDRSPENSDPLWVLVSEKLCLDS